MVKDAHEDLMGMLMEAHQPVKKVRPPRPWYNKRKQKVHEQRETTHTISNVAIGELVRSEPGTVGLFEVKEGGDYHKARIYILVQAKQAKGKVTTHMFMGATLRGHVVRIIRVVVVIQGDAYPAMKTAPAPNLPQDGICKKCGYTRPPMKPMLAERKRRTDERHHRNAEQRRVQKAQKYIDGLKSKS